MIESSQPGKEFTIPKAQLIAKIPYFDALLGSEFADAANCRFKVETSIEQLSYKVEKVLFVDYIERGVDADRSNILDAFLEEPVARLNKDEVELLGATLPDWLRHSQLSIFELVRLYKLSDYYNVILVRSAVQGLLYWQIYSSGLILVYDDEESKPSNSLKEISDIMKPFLMASEALPELVPLRQLLMLWFLPTSVIADCKSFRSGTTSEIVINHDFLLGKARARTLAALLSLGSQMYASVLDDMLELSFKVQSYAKFQLTLLLSSAHQQYMNEGRSNHAKVDQCLGHISIMMNDSVFQVLTHMLTDWQDHEESVRGRLQELATVHTEEWAYEQIEVKFMALTFMNSVNHQVMALWSGRQLIRLYILICCGTYGFAKWHEKKYWELLNHIIPTLKRQWSSLGLNGELNDFKSEEIKKLEQDMHEFCEMRIE